MTEKSNNKLNRRIAITLDKEKELTEKLKVPKKLIE